jgi:hypothetical protein
MRFGPFVPPASAGPRLKGELVVAFGQPAGFAVVELEKPLIPEPLSETAADAAESDEPAPTGDFPRAAATPSTGFS